MSFLRKSRNRKNCFSFNKYFFIKNIFVSRSWYDFSSEKHKFSWKNMFFFKKKNFSSHFVQKAIFLLKTIYFSSNTHDGPIEKYGLYLKKHVFMSKNVFFDIKTWKIRFWSSIVKLLPHSDSAVQKLGILTFWEFWPQKIISGPVCDLSVRISRERFHDTTPYNIISHVIHVYGHIRIWKFGLM